METDSSKDRSTFSIAIAAIIYGETSLKKINKNNKAIVTVLTDLVLHILMLVLIIWRNIKTISPS